MGTVVVKLAPARSVPPSNVKPLAPVLPPRLLAWSVPPLPSLMIGTSSVPPVWMSAPPVVPPISSEAAEAVPLLRLAVPPLSITASTPALGVVALSSASQLEPVCQSAGPATSQARKFWRLETP